MNGRPYNSDYWNYCRIIFYDDNKFLQMGVKYNKPLK